MTASALFDNLSQQSVLLWADGERLHVRAPSGVLTPDLRSELALRKADILALLRERGKEKIRQEIPQIVPRADQRFQPFPLTDIQRAYMVGRSGAFEPGEVACHAYYEVEADRLDLDRFNHAFQRLINRHDMLRAIVLPDGRQQILENTPPYRIDLLDLRAETAQCVGRRLESIRESMSHEVLPADRWPLFNIRATRLDGDRVRLHFSFDILILDVWSIQIIFKEWCELYHNPEMTPAPLDLSFRDYVLAEIGLRDSEQYERANTYWAARLDSLPPAPELPLAAVRAANVESRFVRRSAQIEAQTWAQLKSRASSIGLTPSSLLLTAFSEILTTWSKSPRFTLNVTLLNRFPLHPQVNKIVGDFTSVIPLEVDNSLPEAFEARAGRIQSQLHKDLDHRLMSGVEIMRRQARARKESLPETLPVVFTSLLNQGADGRSPAPTFWMGEEIYGITQTPQVWIDHQVFEIEGALGFNWDSVDCMFPEGLLQDMFEAYGQLLRDLASSEQRWLDPHRKPLPPHQLLQREAVNDTASPLRETLLHTLFCERAKVCPDQIAVVSNGGRLSYRELDRLSNQVAHRLRRLGACPNRLVAVVMKKGWEQITAVLGVLKSGAAYLPLSPDLPKDRLCHLLEHAEVGIVLTQPALEQNLEWPESVTTICMDQTARGSLYDLPLEPVQAPSDLAYVIYTSGSTGKPKGVMIDHLGAVNTILDINRRFDVGVRDRVLALSELSFDLSVFDVFGSLAAGATVIIPAEETKRDPDALALLLRSEQVTIWNSVPALMEMLVVNAFGERDALPASLRLALLSGDWIPVTLPDQIRALLPGIEIISLGGATEASIWSICYRISDVRPDWKSIPYGKPMSNQKFYVLDHAMEPAPVWAQGHLYIGGKGLALGYWRDEERTRASFIIHPQTGERLYRTGDLGRYLPDGNIEFLGREDLQVKVQGYRVEPGEIESVMAKHPAVRASAVKVIGKPQESKRLVAYILPEEATRPSVEELRSFLKTRLPHYMMPSTFVMLEALPLTFNGKVDRNALPDPKACSSGPYADPPAQETQIENRIKAIIGGVLGLRHLDKNADLFELGATSLEMVRIVKRLEQELDFRPGLEDLYRLPTVAAVVESYHRHLCRYGNDEGSISKGASGGN